MDRKKAKPTEEVKLLSNLSPAETLLVLKGSNAEHKELLKLTFMDLLLKQVLRTFHHEIQKRNKTRILKYVEAGKQFSNYQPLHHEKVFLSAFQKNREIQILFRHMVKLGFQNAKTQQHYQGQIIKNHSLNGVIKRNIFQSMFGLFTITPAGIDLKKKLLAEIIQLETDLPHLLVNDAQAAHTIVNEIKGNIFLVKGINLGLLTHLDNELHAELNRQHKSSGDGGCSGGTDSGCSWDSGHGGHSGCSGGGCSGCSGCGGCGGCGS